MMTRIRRRLMPRCFADWLGVTFHLIMYPVVFVFHLLVLLPAWLGESPGSSPLYLLHALFSVCLLTGVVSSFLGVFLADPSVLGRLLATPSPSDPHYARWRLCSVCEALQPPRSWHCEACGVCILKRDHHCMFTACCIGFDNQRYFISLLAYLSASTLYSGCFSIYFLWLVTPLSSAASLLKLLFPMAAIVFSTDPPLLQVQRLIGVLILVAGVAVNSLLAYHVMNLIAGRTTYEKQSGGGGRAEYDLGGAAANMRAALGKRWLFAIVSPFASSPFPDGIDGVNWPVSDKSK